MTLWQELINNFNSDPSILFGLKCAAAIIFVLLTAYVVEHYFKPKTALEELLEEVELNKQVEQKVEIVSPTPVYKAEQWLQ